MTGSNNYLQQFKEEVGTKFQLYNSLFTSLPFHRIEKTGVLLTLFLLHCEDGFRKHQSPQMIVESFLEQFGFSHSKEGTDLLFLFIQYAERQVVLFDALEDAAFADINDLNGQGSLHNLLIEFSHEKDKKQIEKHLKNFAVRIVLTAHPTQFYPDEVLGILNDLSNALQKDNASLINSYLQQLGKTPFLKSKKPTPFDEALSLIWFLENTFYPAAGNILMEWRNADPSLHCNDKMISMGFWPGGDRDGNPYVTAKTTLLVSEALHKSILKCYYKDIIRLRRRLTFKGVEEKIIEVEALLYDHIFLEKSGNPVSVKDILKILSEAETVLIEKHNSLFLPLLQNLIDKVKTFGTYFATLDLRQDSSIIADVMKAIDAQTPILPDGYFGKTEDEKIDILSKIESAADAEIFEEGVIKDTFRSMQVMREIQNRYGENACYRYILSHSTSALNLMEIYALLILSGWKKATLSVDIVPLFETIPDLENASKVMEQLYRNDTYRGHLKQRNNTQTIMLGFSDGTKDGGYFMANYSIYLAKKSLTKLAREYGISLIFFDGRGGPPARGGGKTHKFYASMGKEIANNEIQLTIQGQTVSSNFGTVLSAQFNFEQLLHAGLGNELYLENRETFSEQQESLLSELASESYQSYLKLKTNPHFVDYLSDISPLRYYADTNIGSRPARRKGPAKLNLNTLRAIPFVGSWSQLKQNVPGYYGLGTALKNMEEKGKFDELKAVYQEVVFFKTLIDNCEMALKKSFFPLTAYLKDDETFGELWQMMKNENDLTVEYVLKLSGNSELMQDYPVEQLSIEMRERIVLPLATIQQFALSKIRSMEEDDKGDEAVFGKMAMRCSFGLINAGRNSA